MDAKTYLTPLLAAMTLMATPVPTESPAAGFCSSRRVFVHQAPVFVHKAPVVIRKKIVQQVVPQVVVVPQVTVVPQLVYVPNAIQGQTQYGYGSQNTYEQSSYNFQQSTQSLELAINALGSSQQRSVALAEQINTLLGGIVERMGHQQNTLAEKLAAVQQTKANAELLRANAQSLHQRSITRERTTDSSHYDRKWPIQSGPPPPPPPPPPDLGVQIEPPFGQILSAVISRSCVKCHNPDVRKAEPSELFPDGLDMTKFELFDADQRERVMTMIIEGRMPKGAEELLADERTLFFHWYLGRE